VKRTRKGTKTMTKAKTVGQIMSALLKAVAESSPTTTVTTTFADGEYTVRVGNIEVTAEKLYNAFSQAAKKWLGNPEESNARARLRARVGGDAPDLVDAEDGNDF
jgi:hypothetical protein